MSYFTIPDATDYHRITNATDYQTITNATDHHWLCCLCGAQVRLVNGGHSWKMPDLRYDLRNNSTAHLQPEAGKPSRRSGSGARRSISRKAVANPDVGTEEDAFSEAIPFDIILPADLFDHGPVASVVFSDCDDTNITYSQMYIRQVSCPALIAWSAKSRTVKI